MPDQDLRPLSLGEILDRTFTLYRRNFLLFFGITALPQLLVLGFNLFQILVKGRPAVSKEVSASVVGLGILAALLGFVVYLVAYLFVHGGTVYAVSDLYLGRSTSIGACLRRMRGQAGTLSGVLILNGLVVMAALIFLIIPGIYMACRLMTCIPAALLENYRRPGIARLLPFLRRTRPGWGLRRMRISQIMRRLVPRSYPRAILR